MQRRGKGNHQLKTLKEFLGGLLETLQTKTLMPIEWKGHTSVR
jgi:hypothetical protein